MDGGGRFAEPLNRPEPGRDASSDRARTKRRRPRRARPGGVRLHRAWFATGWFHSIDRWTRRWLEPLVQVHVPRGAGTTAFILIIACSLVYGTIRGGHLADVTAYLEDARDNAANAVGFRIARIALSGYKHLTREEILAAAGITGRRSLLFLDVADTRTRLKSNPWIADATVQKLYPDGLQVTIVERAAFALWQKDGRVAVIAADGTVLEPFVTRRFTRLPLFVGAGAETRAGELLTLLHRYPDIHDMVRASVLVAGRRWNLRLKNGVDVRLPESDVKQALARLVALEHDKKILSRDISAIDLRLPDRVTVRLSEAAAQAREESLKAKKPKAKGGDV